MNKLLLENFEVNYKRLEIGKKKMNLVINFNVDIPISNEIREILFFFVNPILSSK